MNFVLLILLFLFVEYKYCLHNTRFFRIYNSSIFCTGTNPSQRYCYIKHLYYFPTLDNFFLVQGDGSELNGFLKEDFDFDRFIETSSIHAHNFHTLSLKQLNFSQFYKENFFHVKVIREPTILFSRFYPINLMHSFHDDLIPLYRTLNVFNCIFSVLVENLNNFNNLKLTNMDIFDKYIEDIVMILNLTESEKIFLINEIKKSLQNDFNKTNINKSALILLIYFMRYLDSNMLDNIYNLYNHCSKIKMNSSFNGFLFFADNYGYNFQNLFSIFSKYRPILQNYLKCTNDYIDIKSKMYYLKMQNISTLYNDYIDFYKHKFNYLYAKNWLKENIQNSYSNCIPIRFENIFVGISRSSGWYQYGFKKPQEPLKYIQIDGKFIKNFTSYFRAFFFNNEEYHSNRIKLDSFSESFDEYHLCNRLNNDIQLQNYLTTESYVKKCNNMNKKILPKTKLIIIFSRKQNRIILNELQLMLNLSLTLRAIVKVVSLETHTLIDIMGLVSQADIIIGVHGSLLIMLMFLPKMSLIIELFPFGINPSHYTPYKTLSNLKNMNLYYASWRCMHKNCSHAYEDRPPHLGGIKHLDNISRNKIRTSHEVPQHLCCSDPHWLHRIYQDLWANIGEILVLIKCWEKLDNKIIFPIICNQENVELHYN